MRVEGEKPRRLKYGSKMWKEAYLIQFNSGFWILDSSITIILLYLWAIFFFSPCHCHCPSRWRCSLIQTLTNTHAHTHAWDVSLPYSSLQAQIFNQPFFSSLLLPFAQFYFPPFLNFTSSSLPLFTVLYCVWALSIGRVDKEGGTGKISSSS